MQVWKLQILMIVERYQEMTEIPIVYWPQCKREQDFLTNMDRSLSICLPSQLVDYVR